MTDALHALSPLDGRYADAAAPLRDFFSEFAYLRGRVRVELDFLAALSDLGLFRPLSASESARLASVHADFSDADAESILAYERQTRHDVKAIEYFLRDKLQTNSLADAIPWLHFGLTSEDVNNLAQALALKGSRDQVILPALDSLLAALCDFALRHRAVPMLARTHGQPAVPTTLGKEFAVYAARLQKVRAEIASFRFEAKLTGAVATSTPCKPPPRAWTGPRSADPSSRVSTSNPTSSPHKSFPTTTGSATSTSSASPTPS